MYYSKLSYGFAIKEWLFGMGIIFAKLLLEHSCICHITGGFATCDMIYMHLCSCKSFSKIVPILKNYKPRCAL